MLIARSAVPEDIDALLALSAQTGLGMTTMPTDRRTWEAKLAANADSFRENSNEQGQGTFMLVLEDTETQQLVGCSALYSNIGVDRPFYSYKISKVTTTSKELDVTVHLEALHLVNDYTDCTEIGSLFLLPAYRKNGNGQFLSRCRFMLIADHRKRFNDLVFAEIRGWFDEEGASPFWEFLGRKFFGLSYEKADLISAVNGSQFISDLMPKYPIYLNLLPQAAQDAIGKPNPDAVPALKILERENFQYTGYVDIFDAGPCVQCKTDQIQSIRKSNVKEVHSVSDATDLNSRKKDDLFILSNRNLGDYRTALQPIILLQDQVIINRETAEHLRLAPGDRLRYLKLTETSS